MMTWCAVDPVSVTALRSEAAFSRSRKSTARQECIEAVRRRILHTLSLALCHQPSPVRAFLSYLWYALALGVNTLARSGPRPRPVRTGRGGSRLASFLLPFLPFQAANIASRNAVPVRSPISARSRPSSIQLRAARNP